MKTIRATCPMCTDEVDLHPQAITLHLVDPLRAVDGDKNRYAFRCPACDVFVVKPAGEHAIELLIEGGVELSTAAQAPWELGPSHPETPPSGPAFTADDVLDLHLKLQEPGWFDELASFTGLQPRTSRRWPW
ncbi:MAG: hypothetical protein KY457_04990 [Actinobacteria bacterium]|nr:hypothetical protein [Actinomycetota bacterium]